MVTCVAGYSARELAGQDTQFFVNAGPIKAATILQIVKEFKQIVLQQKGNAGFTAGPLASERLGDYAYSTGGNSAMLSAGMGINLMPEVENMLAPYRHFGLSLVA